MNKALWAVQVLLAAAFGLAGFFKLTTPGVELAAAMPYVETTGLWAARLAGTAEVLGAVGLILPSLLRIAPKLTPLAAGGLATVMLLAMGVHGFRAEWAALAPNVVLGSLAAFVAWGRTVKAPIEPHRAAGTAASAY